MSSRHWIFRINDILQAIERIEQYTNGMALAKFKQSSLVIDAVVRNFEIIGEACKNIPSAVQHSYPEIPWKEIKGMRDVLIHEYFGVDLKILWHASRRNLPALKGQLEDLLRNVKRDG